MTTAGAVLLALAAVAAVADWVAVARRPSRFEYVAKPAVLALLVLAAVALHAEDGGQRAWFVVALALCLVGDILLLPRPDLFVGGLAAFLLGHVAYVVGFLVRGDQRGRWAVAGVAVVVVALVGIAPRIVQSVRGDDPALLPPVVVYMGVISAMVVAAFASGDGVAAAGAVLFFASDATLATDRFVRPSRWAPLAVIVAYHLGQGLLVLSVASTK